MATIELIIRDDKGNIINSKTGKEYKMELGTSKFHDIEGAVEKFRKLVLADIEADILQAKQREFVEDIKKQKN